MYLYKVMYPLSNPPNKYAQDEGVKLGLSREQVTARNFGYHTINAIRTEIEKGTSLEDAFVKYRDLNLPQIEAMTVLGFSREQVTAPNFGNHTIRAISDIQKRTEELSSSDAFEMVKGKSYKDTQEFVESYLKATKKAQKPLNEMTLIRVVVNTGRGFGHQRASITLMQKLREMGFKGIFDIQCDDRLGATLMNTKTRKIYRNEEPLVSRQLIGMISRFESANPNREGVRIVTGLGAVKISSLPHDYTSRDNLELPEVDLAVCAAEDKSIQEEDKKTKMFNAASYIGLEPTDWHQGSCFVTDQDGIVTELPPASAMRLSSAAASQLPDISSITLSAIEQRIIDITSNTGINSQLVYGLYPEKHYSTESGGIKETGNLDEVTEMQRIVDANLLLSQKTGQPSILLLPQKIALDADFIGIVKGKNDNIHLVDLTKDDLDIGVFKAGDVVVAHTGLLQQTVFDHLMLQGTTLPPVIEGCNSRESCESFGRPFIHGSGKHDPLKQYEVEAGDKLQLHTKASLCLEQGDPKYVPQLVQYMEESVASNRELMAYHAQRREAFFKRPDACEVAFNALGIKYEIEFQKPAKLRCGAMFFSHKQSAEDHDSPKAQQENDAQQLGLKK
ncbi:hypothetical protein [Legionella tucsonensis]|uniref:Uncharacterized protein n=1 Tax=Legionella tucsonensis TaxID=40335 RepID=A0A0W0ZV83_9GAMM|nr:hypothetical protein [Legionella tucsonensis]KTD72720.1 hypothetical protein Ltuc_0567 [Legionella tucsonensis]